MSGDKVESTIGTNETTRKSSKRLLERVCDDGKRDLLVGIPSGAKEILVRVHTFEVVVATNVTHLHDLMFRTYDGNHLFDLACSHRPRLPLAYGLEAVMIQAPKTKVTKVTKGKRLCWFDEGDTSEELQLNMKEMSQITRV